MQANGVGVVSIMVAMDMMGVWFVQHSVSFTLNSGGRKNQGTSVE